MFRIFAVISLTLTLFGCGEIVTSEDQGMLDSVRRLSDHELRTELRKKIADDPIIKIEMAKRENNNLAEEAFDRLDVWKTAVENEAKRRGIVNDLNYFDDKVLDSIRQMSGDELQMELRQIPMLNNRIAQNEDEDVRRKLEFTKTALEHEAKRRGFIND